MRYTVPDAKLLITACEEGRLDSVKVILEKNAQLINARDTAGETPLMVAIRSQNQEIITELLAQTQDFNAKNNLNETALIIAIHTEDKSTFKALLSKPSIDLRVQSGHWGTALTCAICLEAFDLAKEIIQKETVCSDKNHPGALHCAVEKKNLTLVIELARKGAQKDINTFKYAHYASPDHWILKTMAYDEVPFPEFGANFTPLQIAVQNGDIKMVRLLIKLGAEIDRIQDGTCPLLLAAKSGSIKMLNLLINEKADKKVKIGGIPVDCLILNDSRIENSVKAQFNIDKGNGTTTPRLFKLDTKLPNTQQEGTSNHVNLNA